MPEPYIECSSLSKTYFSRGHEVKALINVNTSFDKNQFIILRGRSGAGKSTFLNLIGGLVRPTTGTIRIGGQIINELDNSALSRLLLERIGVIFQSFNLLPAYTVYENIEIALFPAGLKTGEIRKLIMPFAEQFSLTDKLDLLPEELSVGQQQKVAIIRTLVKNPELILADEPTGSVDEQTANEIIGFLRYLNKERHATVILATHGIVAHTPDDVIMKIENGYVEKA